MIPAGGWAVVIDPEYSGEYEIPEAAVLLVPDDACNASAFVSV